MVPPERARHVVSLDDRCRQVGHQLLHHADGTRAGPSPAVRRRERLVRVDVHDVEAHVAGAASAEDRVEVRAVVVHEPADAVDDPRDLLDLLFEQTERVRVGQHESGHLVVDELLEHAHVDQTARVRGHRHRLEPGEVHARRVRPVRRVRDDDLRPPAAALRVIRAHHQQAGHLAARAGGRLQRGACHPGDLAERLLEPPQHLERTLGRLIRLQRVHALEPRERGDGLGDLRVVLHGAGAQRVEACVHAVVHLRQPRVVADQVDLGDLGQPGVGAAASLFRDRRLRDV